MRRLLRIILWMVKGLMLLIALAALVMWPVSRGRWLGVGATRYIERPEWVEWRGYQAGCWDGRVVIRSGWEQYSGAAIPDWVRADAQDSGAGWRWDLWSDTAVWDQVLWPSRWGPFRWNFRRQNDTRATAVARWYAAPLWLVALVAAMWPLPSIAFAVRRRAKRRRAAREGLCKECGYDLRATPAAGGALLAVCPECGKETHAGNTPGPSRS